MTTKLENRTAEALRIIKREASAVVRQTLFEIEAGIKADMASPKNGREYKRKSGTHRSSTKGEAPAIDSAVLVNSISTVIEDELSGEVGTAVEYGPILEEPLERPAFDRAYKKAKNIFQKRIQKIK